MGERANYKDKKRRQGEGESKRGRYRNVCIRNRWGEAEGEKTKTESRVSNTVMLQSAKRGHMCAADSLVTSLQ